MTASWVVLITGTSSDTGIGYATVRNPSTAADVASGAGPGRVEVAALDLHVWGTMALEEVGT